MRNFVETFFLTYPEAPQINSDEFLKGENIMSQSIHQLSSLVSFTELQGEAH